MEVWIWDKTTTSMILRLHVPKEVKPFKVELFSSAVKVLKAAYWSRRTSMSIWLGRKSVLCYRVYCITVNIYARCPHNNAQQPPLAHPLTPSLKILEELAQTLQSELLLLFPVFTLLILRLLFLMCIFIHPWSDERPMWERSLFWVKKLLDLR